MAESESIETPTETAAAAAAPEAPAQAAPPPPPVDPLQELRATVTRLTDEKKELHDRMLRVAADFENYKRRARKEMDDAGTRALEGLLKEVLPVVDNLDRALQAVPKGEKAQEPVIAGLVSGVSLVQKQFLAALEKFQIKSFDAEGKPFDPAVHEAVAQVDSETLAPGTVAVVYQRGYTAGSRLLRPALVAVVRPRPQAAPSEGAGGGGGEGDLGQGELVH